MASSLVERLQTILKLRATGRWAEADEQAQSVLADYPDHSGALTLAGIVSAHLGRMDEALARLKKVVDRDPTPEAWNNYAMTLKSANHLDDAADAWRRAIVMNPGYNLARNHLALLLSDQRQFDEALKTIEAVLEADANDGDAHVTRAMILLLLGRFEEGWREWEWRWRARQFQTRPPSFAAPQWDANSPAGKTLLLHAERGFGDAIQFVRYAPILAERGARVLLEATRPLMPLFATVRGVTSVYERGAPLPPIDAHVPLMSLPLLMSTRVDNVPADVPYLKPENDKVGFWKRYMTRTPGGVNAGIVWAGSPTHQRNAHRSLKFDELAPLLKLPGVTWYSLQKGPQAAERPTGPYAPRVVDLDPELSDFADTAAALTCLDLLITVDTSVAHLAGALAVKTWMFLPFAPDFRWLLDREDTPWYPTLRLFREQTWGERIGVVQRMADALAQAVQRGDLRADRQRE